MKKILIAVSGGIDSVVLLDLLAKEKLEQFISREIPMIGEIVVANFDHKIHSKSAAQQKFVEKLATKYDLEFFAGATKKKLKSEADARDARFEFLEKVAEKENCDLIALAQHADDQVETIFLNLIRGSGLTGAAGMAEINDKKWRPLLDIPKSKIETYAKKNKLKCVVDPTNKDEKYSRNFLRRQVLPKFEKLNPKFTDAILRFGRTARENSEFLGEIATNWLLELEKKQSIDLAEFRQLPPILQKEVLRQIYLAAIGDLQRLEEKHLIEILELADNSAGNKKKKLGKLIFRTTKRGGRRILEWSRKF